MKKDIIRTQEYKHTITICDFCKKDENLGNNNKCFICGKDVCFHCSEYHSAYLPSDDDEDIQYIEARICPECKKRGLSKSQINLLIQLDDFNQKYETLSDEFFEIYKEVERIKKIYSNVHHLF